MSGPAALLLSALGLCALAVVGQAGAAPAAMPGVANPEQARIDYILKCQGCHQPDGSGDIAHTPPLKGEVARFLHVPGGREFLARVPGVASVDLSDARLAQLLNWTVLRFDRAHVPADFAPYSAAEIAQLRRRPIRLERQATRASLVTAIGDRAQGD
ncbi:c-type cytochrome [Erythrobacter tepidarius]|uniref:c-type cytochrome n=1 Tax=Erythrobacter tepidarius TaxID=60454 RepID=UPI001FECEA67|nr:cytochrome C [Erythrobacter tepidarius]